MQATERDLPPVLCPSLPASLFLVPLRSVLRPTVFWCILEQAASPLWSCSLTPRPPLSLLGPGPEHSTGQSKHIPAVLISSSWKPRVGAGPGAARMENPTCFDLDHLTQSCCLWADRNAETSWIGEPNSLCPSQPSFLFSR